MKKLILLFSVFLSVSAQADIGDEHNCYFSGQKNAKLAFEETDKKGNANVTYYYGGGVYSEDNVYDYSGSVKLGKAKLTKTLPRRGYGVYVVVAGKKVNGKISYKTMPGSIPFGGKIENNSVAGFTFLDPSTQQPRTERATCLVTNSNNAFLKYNLKEARAKRRNID